MVGVDLPFDEPQSPDLVLQNDGERTPLELVEEIEGRSTRTSWSTPSTIPITGTCIIKTSSAPPAPPLRPVCVHPGGAGADAGGAGVRQRAGRPLLCLSGAGRGGDGPL
ncbi:hypothetical protein M5E87_16370 [Flavonifractor plautii]|nr:hypothetical protein M5E87_16370 [Flavonifractor plautii]